MKSGNTWLSHKIENENKYNERTGETFFNITRKVKMTKIFFHLNTCVVLHKKVYYVISFAQRAGSVLLLLKVQFTVIESKLDEC